MKINKIAIIGLGYVGAPLMHSLLINKFNCVRLDRSQMRIKQLLEGVDVKRQNRQKQSFFLNIKFLIILSFLKTVIYL